MGCATATARPSACAGWARHCRSCAACSTGPRRRASGPRYTAKSVRNDPPPLQRHLPILIGGGGEKVTLKLVARYADMHDMGGDLATVKRKDDILREHCAAIGRDFDSIERSHGLGVVVIRDSREEARKVAAGLFERNGHARIWQDQPVGTPEDVAAAAGARSSRSGGRT